MTINVKDSSGAVVAVETPAALGRAAAAASKPVALSTEDKAAVDAMSAKLPASLGQKASTLSLAVIHSVDVPVDRSGTTSATPSTAANAMASNSSRKGFQIQNVSTTAGMWFNGLGTATAGSGSFYLAPGSLYETPLGMSPTGAISVISTTASVPFTAREW